MKRTIISLALGLCCLLALSLRGWAEGLGGTYTKGGAETPFSDQASLKDVLSDKEVKGNITKLVINAGDITSADWNWVKDNSGAFEKLTELEITSSVNSVGEFQGATYATSFFNFPILEKLTFCKVKMIPEGVLKNVFKTLKELYLPDVEEIGMGVFCHLDAGKKPLITVSMPRCKKIGSSNFTENQGNLKLLILGVTPPAVTIDAAHWKEYIGDCEVKLVHEDGTALSPAEFATAKAAYLASNNTNGKWQGLYFEGSETFNIALPTPTAKGKLEVSDENPSEGDLVTLIPTPGEKTSAAQSGSGGGSAGSTGEVEKQYMLDLESVKIVQAIGGTQEVPFNKETMTFVMPKFDVSVRGSFVDNKIKVVFTSQKDENTTETHEFTGNMMKDILAKVDHEMGSTGSIHDDKYRTKVRGVEVKEGAFTATSYIQLSKQLNVTGQGFDNAYINIHSITVGAGVSSHALQTNGNGSSLPGTTREIKLHKLPKIENAALAQLPSLQKAILPDTKQFGVSALKKNAALKTLEAPLLERIDKEGLMGCESLVSLKFPRLHTIEENAFAGCKSLTTLYLGAYPPVVFTKEGVSNSFYELPEERSIVLVDKDGTPLTGDALAQAAKRYKESKADGNATDNLFFGWKVLDKISYEITIGTSEHGTISVPERAVAGDKIKLTVNAHNGFIEKRIYYTKAGDTQQHDISIDDCTFDMPDCAVTISVEYEVSKMTVTVNGKKKGTGTTLKLAVEDAGYTDQTSPDLSGVTSIEVTSGVFGAGEWTNLKNFIPGTNNLESFVINDAVRIGAMPGDMVITDKTKTAEVGIASASLKYVRIPKIKRITERAFEEAKALEKVECPDVEKLGQNVFSKCESLKEIIFPKLKATGVPKGAFMGCKALENVNNLPELTEIPADLFNGCTSLKEVPFADKITSINDAAFKNCHALEKLDCPQLTYIGKNAFDGCKAIASLALPRCENIADEAFQGCDALTEIALPALTTVGAGAFANSKMLKVINLPQLKEVAELCFNGCAELKTIQLPAVTKVGNLAFCTRIIKDPENEDANEYKGFEKIETLALPKVETIGEYALYGCKNLKNFYAPRLQALGSYALNGCTSLTKVNFAMLSNLGERAFAHCTGITTLILPSLEGVEKQAFFQCTELDSLVAVKLNRIDEAAFEGCSKLASLTLGEKLPVIEEDKNPFASKPEVRTLTLAVSKEKFLETKNKYATVQDGTPEDGKWYGWTIAETKFSSVNFVVKVGTAPLVGAVITIFDGEKSVDLKVADFEGKAELLLTAGNYNYMVTAEGHATKIGTLIVGEDAQQVDVAMETSTPTHLLFTVKKDNKPVVGANIVVKHKTTSIEITQLTTTPDGRATCDLFPETYTYEVTAENCAPLEPQELVVEKEEKTIEVSMLSNELRHVSFTVKKGAEPLAGAQIVVKNKATGQEATTPLTTNDKGEAACDLLPATYTYEVTAQGCSPIPATDLVVAAEAQKVEVLMTAVVNTHVLFVVKKGSEPLAGAQIVVKNKATGQEAITPLTTDDKGEAACDLLPATYTYEVTAQGYTSIPATDLVVTTEEQKVEITMTPTAVEDALWASVTVAPNPFTTHLRVLLAAEMGLLHYELVTSSGLSLLRGELDPSGLLDVSHLGAGIYFLRLTTEAGAQQVYQVVKY